MAGTKPEPHSLSKQNRAREDWAVLECDGGSRGNPGPAAIGVVLRLPGGEVVPISKYLGRKTNNEAEYEALLFGLWLAHKRGAHKLTVLMDSELVIKQLYGKYRVKTPHLQPLWRRAIWLLDNRFEEYDLGYIPRGQNEEADALVNLALDRKMGKRRRK